MRKKGWIEDFFSYWTPQTVQIKQPLHFVKLCTADVSTLQNLGRSDMNVQWILEAAPLHTKLLQDTRGWKEMHEHELKQNHNYLSKRNVSIEAENIQEDRKKKRGIRWKQKTRVLEESWFCCHTKTAAKSVASKNTCIFERTNVILMMAQY